MSERFLFRRFRTVAKTSAMAFSLRFRSKVRLTNSPAQESPVSLGRNGENTPRIPDVVASCEYRLAVVM
jgi:hypothetical protein